MLFFIFQTESEGLKYVYYVLHDALQEIENEVEVEGEEQERSMNGRIEMGRESDGEALRSPRRRPCLEEKDAEQILDIADRIITTLCDTVNLFPRDCRIILSRTNQLLQSSQSSPLIR